MPLDTLDQQILLALGDDGRVTASELSRSLPIGERATRLRLERLLESTVSVKALVEPSKIGLPIQALIGLRMEPKGISGTLSKVAAHPCTRYAAGAGGGFDVLFLLVCRSIQHLQEVLLELIPGHDVKGVETSVFAETKVGRFANLSSRVIGLATASEGIDSLDMKLIGLLTEDGRISTRSLAQALSVTELTVQRRLKQLTEDRVVTIRGLVRGQTLGFPVSAVIGLNVDSDRLKSLSDALKSHRQIGLLATCTGTFNLVAMGIFSSSDDLDKFLHESLYPLKGIREARPMAGPGTRAKEAFIVPRLFASSNAPLVIEGARVKGGS